MIFMTNLLVTLVGFYFDINSYMSTTIQENCLKRVRFHSKLIRTKPVSVLSNLCLPENFNAQWLLPSFQEDERKVDLHHPSPVTSVLTALSCFEPLRFRFVDGPGIRGVGIPRHPAALQLEQKYNTYMYK